MTASLRAPEAFKPSEQPPQYMRLAHALQQYQQKMAGYSWISFPENTSLRLQDSSRYVSDLRHNLSLTGDLPAGNETANPVFDEAVAVALKKFQQRHGLLADGVVGQQTLRELNTPPAYRIRQIGVNLKRWQQFAADSAQPLVLVNIPGYTLQLFDKDGKTIWSTRVVVGMTGKAYQTPLLNGYLQYLVLNPGWNVPQSIMRREIIPVLREDKGYLARNHMTLYRQQGGQKTRISVYAVDWSKADPERDRLLMVQEPGPWNALGRIKFVFPNSHAVYLHDTPVKQLFQYTSRAYSHGCVRVEHPDTLAGYLLSEDWGHKKSIKALLKETTPDKAIRLPKQVQVKLGYYTCWVDDSGALQFRQDIYKRDGLPEVELCPQPITYNAGEK
ncbi:L,D-transpeptidase family protein [Pontibacter chitinilyticus]|uniref:L,D-transpeptidase family protein n=1 Tax=Pontibacter chitinilyticus TaxID=2674989 RepID=UPI0032192802